MADESRELTLYVQSKKAVTTFYQPSTTRVGGGAAPALSSPTYDAGASPPSTSASQYEARADESVHFLSDDQARCVALVEEVAQRRSYKVTLIDIEKAGRVERLIAEHLRGVQNFPVLVSPKGGRLEGTASFTEEALSALMPTELKSVRALSYIKVRGGDLDRIRAQLESLDEVKELHFLTGDWDMLAVLDFPPAAGTKRRVLDFVTDRIRGIAEVVDTSTVVPEYSITKFPIP
ncbi:MAG TPA: Lrp/AsnC ligand binding domain-containing protein [Thermoplasmata archaeon]|jgi:DNA-binding Lrp family transcriptional regulator|nr:Lrp/AsnC ligand binding domain-containing protein [Thermoplasmata archaeon]